MFFILYSQIKFLKNYNNNRTIKNQIKMGKKAFQKISFYQLIQLQTKQLKHGYSVTNYSKTITNFIRITISLTKKHE